MSRYETGDRVRLNAPLPVAGFHPLAIPAGTAGVVMSWPVGGDDVRDLAPVRFDPCAISPNPLDVWVNVGRLDPVTVQ